MHHDVMHHDVMHHVMHHDAVKHVGTILMFKLILFHLPPSGEESRLTFITKKIIDLNI